MSETLVVLSELTDRLTRDKHCLAAAEMELGELRDFHKRVEERIAHAERSVKEWADKVDSSWRAVRRRIEAETDSPLEADVVRRRCLVALGPIAGV